LLDLALMLKPNFGSPRPAVNGQQSMAGYKKVGLVGDIGASNARFAIVLPDGRPTVTRSYASSDFGSIHDAVEKFLSDEPAAPRPIQAALAVASPVLGDEVAFTNSAWAFSIEGLRQSLGLERLEVVNDFTAQALAVPLLGPNDTAQVGAGAAISGAPVGLLGPGTGLGVSALVFGPCGPIPVAGEGGHVTMAPATEFENDVLDLMRKRFDHVSAERVLSGPGLVNLYSALCELRSVPAAAFTPAQIASPRIWTGDRLTREATSMFCAMLGTVAGNLALTLGARGGVYVSGGIVPRLGSFFMQSEFRSRFEKKGRFRSYLEKIPTFLVVRPVPALGGLISILKQTTPTS
jgi:glucokinase